MKYLLCFSFLASLAVPCLYAQVQPPPIVPSDTPGFLARTAGETSIDTTAIHPWRINISLQLYDAKGKPAETATIDELWGNATHQRIEWTGASFHRVDYITDHGTYRTVSQGVVPMMLEDMRAAIGIGISAGQGRQ